MHDSQAVRRIGPFPANTPSTHPYYNNRAFRTPAAVNGSASWIVPGTGFASVGNALPGCWVTIKNIGPSASDLLVVTFQNLSLVTSHANADTASDIVILPGEKEEFWLDPGMSSVRFGGPVTAVASHWRSSV